MPALVRKINGASRGDLSNSWPMCLGTVSRDDRYSILVSTSHSSSLLLNTRGFSTTTVSALSVEKFQARKHMNAAIPNWNSGEA